MRFKVKYEDFAKMAETLPVILYGRTERAETLIGRHIRKDTILYICSDDAKWHGAFCEGIPIYPSEKLREEKKDVIIVIAEEPTKTYYLRVKEWGFTHIFSHSTFMFRARSHDVLMEFLRLYAYVLDDYTAPKETANPYPDKIWMFWYTGYETMPALAKHCYHSIQKQAGGREIILIDQNNINQYAPMPDYILDKYHRGFLSIQQLSDILRLVLLENYGGLWIDATVFLSGPIPAEFTQNRLFIYQPEFLNGMPRGNASWMISSEPHNPIVEGTRKCMFEFWKYEYYPHEYYTMLLYWDLVADYADVYRRAWDTVEFASPIPSFILYHDLLFSPYDAKRWSDLRREVSVHKLTYKDPKEWFEIPGTFYQEVVANDEA